MALARGEPIAPPSSRIAEIDDLSNGLRQAAATVQDRNRERDEASRLKDEFLMTVSHELRTPLTAILGWSRMLSSGEIRDGQRPRAMEAIERNAKALHQLVNDLLDVSRIVSGKLRLDVQPVALNETIAAAVDAIRPAADAKGIHLVTSIDLGSRWVNGDSSRLQQVVWNLLSNAVRFTPADGRIDVAVKREGEEIALSVTDTGAGVEPEFLPYVFERFRQGASGTTRSHGGLGLGLAIVRHLVELHGGTVHANNNSSAPGATFRVSLPARTGAGRHDGHAALDVVPPVTNRLDDVDVLVVDDDLHARELFMTILENAGARVKAASSAEDALVILDGWLPDALVSDIEMPNEDGYSLMRKVRARVANDGRLVAIAVTAHVSPNDRAHAIDAGYQWHLAKPIEPSELVSVVATLTARRPVIYAD
jgi:CheY-like chemotaxis protein/anti-sigma regulatory factor (Ser/Thr protein kinase)